MESNGNGMMMMGFGGEMMNNKSGGSSGMLCSPPIMMMPLVTSHHHHHTTNTTNITTTSGHHQPPFLLNPNAHITSSSKTLLPPSPCTNIPSSSSSSSIMTTTNNNNNNNTNTSLNFGSCFMGNNNNNNNNNNNDGGGGSNSSSVKAKIIAHPHYPRLLAAYVNCQKVGAPPEVVARLDEACAAAAIGVGGGGSAAVGEDPALDQFMEAYCEMLIKYEQELSKPFKEAMFFLHNIERQFKALTLDSPIDFACKDTTPDRNESSEDDIDFHHNTNNNGNINNSSNGMIDLHAEDRELKGQLLRKYSGYLGSLKQEFMKKRKKGKLPKEARQQLLDWWSRHYKWPYPSESQKVALAESTGLDQKQINNWFINQRKRHWKPSEDMQFVVMDPILHHPHYFMDNTSSVVPNPYTMDFNFPHHALT